MIDRTVLTSVDERRLAIVGSVVNALAAVGVAVAVHHWYASLDAFSIVFYLVVCGGSGIGASIWLAMTSRRNFRWRIEADAANFYVTRDGQTVSRVALADLVELRCQESCPWPGRGHDEILHVVDAITKDGAEIRIPFLNERRVRRIQRRADLRGLPIRCRFIDDRTPPGTVGR